MSHNGSMPQERENIFITSDGVHIFYNVIQVTDERKYLVLLHGLGGDLTAWDKERRLFTKLGYSTIAIDLRGHGLSDRPIEKLQYGLRLFAKDVLQIINYEKMEKAAVIGHCFGGMVAMYAQAQLPKQSKALILIESSCKPPTFGKIIHNTVFLRSILAILATHCPATHLHGHTDYSKFVDTWDIDVPRFLSDLVHTSLKSYLSGFEDIVGLDATSILSRIIVPTLVIGGTQDIIFPLPIVKALSKRIKNAAFEEIEANHIIVLNNPIELTETINTFLQKIKF